MSESHIRQLVRHAFAEDLLVPADLGPCQHYLRDLCCLVTPQRMTLRAIEGAPTLGEEVRHLLSSLESYLRDCAPSDIGQRDWATVVAQGRLKDAFDDLRIEAEKAIPNIQPERELNYPWLGRRVRVIDLLWHVASHTAHHRGRLSLLLRQCGIEPPQT